MGRDPVLLRVRLLLALFLPALFVALPTASGLGGVATALTTALTVGFAAALVVAVVLHVRLGVSPASTVVRGLSLRERAKLTVYLPLRDPDAPGRSRPRAPGLGSAAA